MKTDDTTGEPILRVAAKGDGVTAGGVHIGGAAPGDRLQSDGSLVRGPHHVQPPCHHFDRCGGCQLQHCDDPTLAEFTQSRVLNAAEGQGVEAEQILPVHLSPPGSRRRATLHASSRSGKPRIGFREAGSHTIVDMQECHILHPELFACVAPIRQMLARRKGRYAADIELSLVDQGVDCAFRNLPVEGLEETEAILEFAKHAKLARLMLDQGYGPEAIWEPEPVTVTLSGTPVAFPSNAFLQATRDGEDRLLRDATLWLHDANRLADLFAGLGTFAFGLARQSSVVAVEASRDAYLASQLAARRYDKPVQAMHRDLFRNPLQLEELQEFDAVLLDPPRAGARDQINLLAQSSVPRIAYISCNPSSWARDAKRLVDGGYRLRQVRAVGQFRWSIHTELTSLFER
ncbi:MAG: class I SAM-dependent RNA methyltransferase [Pontixanthobacter sp.]